MPPRCSVRLCDGDRSTAFSNQLAGGQKQSDKKTHIKPDLGAQPTEAEQSPTSSEAPRLCKTHASGWRCWDLSLSAGRPCFTGCINREALQAVREWVGDARFARLGQPETRSRLSGIDGSAAVGQPSPCRCVRLKRSSKTRESPPPRLPTMDTWSGSRCFSLAVLLGTDWFPQQNWTDTIDRLLDRLVQSFLRFQQSALHRRRRCVTLRAIRLTGLNKNRIQAEKFSVPGSLD